MKTFVAIVLILAAGLAGWWLGRGSNPSGQSSGGREVAFYQSPMHPWIKSDKPGNCTICGMKLTPVYKGEEDIAVQEDVVTLSSNSINVINVQTETVQLRPLERTLEVAGRIESDETRSRVLSAYVDGRIDKLFVNYAGAEVQAGEPLALMYSPALLTAQREYLSALAQTNLADSARFALDHARLLEGARQRLKLLGLTDEQIQAIQPGSPLTNITTQITAPISGTVVTRAVTEGQYVKEGDKLFEMIDLSRLWFRFDVYEQDLHAIRTGQVVQVSSPALPGKKFEGPITFIDPNINEATRSARVRVELQNPVIEGRRLLYNGLYANGRIQLKTEPVLAVSRGALLEPGDHARVYVDRGAGAYEHRLVQPGRRGEDYIEILSGLEAGEKVVVNGNLLIDSQAQINRAGSPHQHGTPTAAPAHPEHSHSSDAPGEDLSQFFKVVNELGAALAADDLDRYNARAAALPVPQNAGLRPLAEKLKEAPAPALDQARVEFLPFSLAVADAAQNLRKQGGNPGVKIYKCPMFPRPGRDALWIQAQGPVRNPFYGSEMLDCGTEVK